MATVRIGAGAPNTGTGNLLAMSITGIVLAGGSGSRVQRDVNKVYLPLGDREMLAYSLETLDRSPVVDDIILVVRDEDRVITQQVISRLPLSTPIDVVPGGESRHQSEFHGLQRAAPRIEAGQVDIVVIHDGARPFMTARLLRATVESARRSGGGVPGLPIEGGVFERTDDESSVALPNQKLRRVQTPQAFRAGALLAAYRRAEHDRREGVDTAETVARYSDLRIEVVPGDLRNIKVTYVQDIFRAEEYAAAFAGGDWAD